MKKQSNSTARMVRNLDPALYNRALAQVKILGYPNIGQYMNEALEAKLKQDEAKKKS